MSAVAARLLLFLNLVNIGSSPVSSVLPVDVVAVRRNRALKSDAGDIQSYVAIFIDLAGGETIFGITQVKATAVLSNRAASALRDPFAIEAGQLAPSCGWAACPVSPIGPVNLATVRRQRAADGVPCRRNQQKWSSQLAGRS